MTRTGKVEGQKWTLWIATVLVGGIAVMLTFGPIATYVPDLVYVGRYPVALRYGLETIVLVTVLALSGIAVKRVLEKKKKGSRNPKRGS